MTLAEQRIAERLRRNLEDKEAAAAQGMSLVDYRKRALRMGRGAR